MKNLIKALVILTLTFVSYSSFATGGATQSMGVSMVQNGVATGAAATYTSTNSAKCSSKNFGACIRAMMGALQIAQLLKQLFDTAGKQQQFGIGDMPSLDDLNGLCLNPESSGCTQDAIDLQISDTPMGEALKAGDYDSFLDAARQTQDDMNQVLSDLEAKGFKVDQEAGTFTGPDGRVQSLASLGNDPNASALPSNVSEALSEKLAALGTSGKTGSAGAGGSGGGVKVIDEYIDGGLNGKRGLASVEGKKKKKKEDFLAAMGDKAGEGAIGVAGDDIFKMIQRRYDKKKKTKEFIFR